MNLDDVYKKGVRIIQGMSIHLRRFIEADYDLIEKLFSDVSVDKYFILRKDHRQNLQLFTKHLLNCMEEYSGFTFVIEDKEGKQTGFIVCEFGQWDREFCAFLSFAILPQYRNLGYATEAVALSIALMGNSIIKNIILEISSSNQYSSKIAKLLGFMPDNTPLYDVFHPEVGVRYNWIKKAPHSNDTINLQELRKKDRIHIPQIENGAYLGFDSDNGQPLYWANTNLIAQKNNIFCLASSPTYLVNNNSYSEDAEDWDLFCWGDTTGRLLESSLKEFPLNICGDIKFDLASAKLNNNWRLPSLSEFEQLEKYCNCEWCKECNVSGMRFISRINKQSIFLPALGLRGGNRSRVYDGGLGCYWTGTLDSSNEPYYFYFGRGGSGIKPVPLYYGVCIRPVTDKF